VNKSLGVVGLLCSASLIIDIVDRRETPPGRDSASKVPFKIQKTSEDSVVDSVHLVVVCSLYFLNI
jgi:hypothetical protein